jgi:hypothetical protein
MLFDTEITENLLTVATTPHPITRQYGFSNLLELRSLNNNERSNFVLPLESEVNLDEYFFKSTPDNLPQIKRYNSETKEIIKISNIKRINTF